MALMWNSSYELGHERIDAEHRIFLDLIADFGAFANNNEPLDKLIRTLKEICKYGDFHFLSEENVMIDCHYPDYEEHAKLHRQLLSQVGNKLFKLTKQQITPDEVFEFLFQWFALHTTTEDKKLVAYIQGG